jgi:hypothetical protein
MVTKNQKPAKKGAQKGDQITDANGAQFHIIEIIFTLQEEAKDVLLEQMQDSSTQMSSAILMPSSNALQVVRIWVIMLTSCGVHQKKSIDISNSITSLNL